MSKKLPFIGAVILVCLMPWQALAASTGAWKNKDAHEKCPFAISIENQKMLNSSDANAPTSRPAPGSNTSDSANS